MRRSFSFLRSAGLVVVAACVALAQTGCSGQPGGASTSGTSGTAGDDVGTVGMKLTLPGGEQLASASWTITGPNGATTVVQSGTVNVQNSQTIALTVGGIPAGSGYTITVNGVSTDGAVTCAGSAGFAVGAQQTSSVTVLMQCMSVTPNTGSANINGTPYTCAVANGASASPSEAVVGGTVSLSASATAANPSALSYAWSASTGTFSAPNASATSFTCTASGSFTMTVTVSDGAVPDGGTCNLSSASVIVQCDVGPDGGAQDATVADGSSSDASSAGETGSDATASDAQSSDAQTSDATATDATATDAQASDAQSSDASADAAAPQAAVVVYRVGTSEAGALSSSATPVFVDSYGSDGTLLGSTAMPTAVSGSNHRLTSSGSATSEGLITLSTDGHHAILTGYDANVGSTAVASSSTTTSPVVLRVVGTVDANGLVDTSTAVTDLSGNNIRSAVSTDGTSLWFTGATGGVFAIQRGASASTLVASLGNTVDGGTASLVNFRQLEIFGAPQQLYASTSSGSSTRVGTVGSGLPTTGGQVVTDLPGFETSTGSPYAFFMADLDGTSGIDTLYVADDSLGLQKWALVNGSWTLKGSIGGSSNAYRGVTGIASNGTVTLYVSGNGATLSKLVDTAAFNTTFSTTTPTWVVNAATGTAIRGVALAPQ